MPVSWNGGVANGIRDGIIYNGNLEIDTANNTVSGGMATVPLYGGMLKSIYAFPDGTIPHTWEVGDILIPQTRSGTNVNIFSKVCRTAGTGGTLAGTTGSTVSGSNVLTVTAGTVVRGRYYNIAGVGTKKIVQQLTSTTWKMNSNAGATVTSGAMSYSAPVFTDTPLSYSLPVYADNAAALGGGLVAGNEYRTATGIKMVVY